MNKQTIYLWGFKREDVVGWPKVFTPVLVTDLPVEKPILVDYHSLEAYCSQVLANPLPDGRLPDALLYLPKGTPPPPDIWAYFDAAVEEGEWAALSRLFDCPQQFRMREMADELPGTFLVDLTRPIQQLSLSVLPLPAEVVTHLDDCLTCRQAFYQAVAERLHWRRQLHWPASAQLEAHLQGVTDRRVATHLTTCKACRRELAILEQAHKDRVSPPWLRLPFPAGEEGLGRFVGERFESMQRSVREGWSQGVEALLTALQGAQMQPSYATRLPAGARAAGARVRRISATTPEPAQLLARLRADGEMRFIGPDRTLLLGWNEERRLLSLQELQEEEQSPLPAFEVSLWQGGLEVWVTQSQAGVVGIPAEMMASGVDEMRIQDSASSN